MNILSKVVDWLYNQARKLSFKDYIIILLSLLALGFFISSRHYYKKSLYPTVIYSSDTLSVYKNKLNEEYQAKKIYVQTIEQLKKENEEMYTEIKNLKDHPLVVTKTEVKFKTDTIYMQSDTIINVNDSIKSLHWHSVEPNHYYTITGQTDVHTDFSSFSTQVNSLEIPGTLTIDIVEKNKQLTVIGKTDNPYISITNADGVVIDPTKSSVIKSYFKPKRWNIGPQVGVGLSSDLKFRPYIGVGISYGLFQF